MFKYKTNTTKAILEPVCQQISSLVLLGEYIEKGYTLIDLPTKILKIVESTNGVVQAIKKFLLNSPDEILTKRVTELSLKISESMDILKKSADLLMKDEKSLEGAHLVALGANGIISNILEVLISYDDSQVRMIENNLKIIKCEISKHLTFDEASIVSFIQILDQNIKHAGSLLQTRSKEIISPQLSRVIQTLKDELSNNWVSLLNEFDQVVKMTGTPYQILNIVHVGLLTFNIYRISVELLSIIWLEELNDAEIYIFASTIEARRDLAEDWMQSCTKYQNMDFGGKYAIKNILENCEKIYSQQQIYSGNLEKTIVKLHSDLREFSNSRTMTKCLWTDSQYQTMSVGLKDVVDTFLKWYNIWKGKKIEERKAIDTINNDPSSYISFAEYKNFANTILKAADTIINNNVNSNGTLTNADVIRNLIQSKLNEVGMENEFNTKGEIYESVNSKLKELCDVINQVCCDNYLDSIINAHQSLNSFHSDMKNFYESNTNEDAQRIQDAQRKLEDCQTEIQKLTSVANNVVTLSGGLPLEKQLEINKILEEISYLGDAIKISFDYLKQNKTDTIMQNKLRGSVTEIDDLLDSLQDKIMPVLAYEKITNFTLKTAQTGCQALKRCLETNNFTNYKPQLDKITASFDILSEKMKKEEANNEKEVADKFKGFNNDISKIRIQLRKHCEALANQFSPEMLESSVKDIESGLVTIQKCKEINQAPEPVTLVPVEKVVQVIEQLPACEEVPEKYKEAFAIIEKPSSDDRIAVAAAELHQQAQSNLQTDKSLRNMVLEISYEFADMSKLFKNPEKHSEMIETAKNIALNTQKVLGAAKVILDSCRDHRLKQILSCCMEKLPTVSQQLKIMSALRASRLKAMKNVVNKETQETNEMLIGCAENLMKVLKDVVKAAESASIKAKPVITKSMYSDL